MKRCLVSIVAHARVSLLLPRPPQANCGDRCLRVPRRIRVAAERGPGGHRVRRQKPADERRRQAAEDELAADREQAGLGEIDPEGEALAVSPKGERTQLDLGIEVLSRAIARSGRSSRAARRRAPASRRRPCRPRAAIARSRTRRSVRHRSGTARSPFSMRRTSRRWAPAVPECCGERRSPPAVSRAA